ncbi:MAG: hypothetical protein IKW74_01650 [Thermoguttaceae bacterium]|nr:hypothetical protein [Thermoguttaceae bacterium]
MFFTPPRLSLSQAILKMVSSNITSIKTLDDLQLFVYQTLCRDHELLMNAFPTTETIIRKSNGNSCGMMFCLHGPRTVKFTAIWEMEKNRIFFYGPCGERYQQVTLKESPVNEIDIEQKTLFESRHTRSFAVQR